jgi:hypothetical protein
MSVLLFVLQIVPSDLIVVSTNRTCVSRFDNSLIQMLALTLTLDPFPQPFYHYTDFQMPADLPAWCVNSDSRSSSLNLC